MPTWEDVAKHLSDETAVIAGAPIAVVLLLIIIGVTVWLLFSREIIGLKAQIAALNERLKLKDDQLALKDETIMLQSKMQTGAVTARGLEGQATSTQLASENLIPYAEWLRRETEPIEGSTLRGEVVLDGRAYRNCTFIDPTFVYRATGVFELVNPRFEGKKPILDTDIMALNSTVAYLKSCAFMLRDARIKSYS